MDNAWLIHTTALTKVFPGGVRALDGVDLTVRPGEFLAVMGPSGSGKSTLLHLLGALDRPSAGDLHVAGEDLSRLRDVDRFRSRTVGFVFQMHNLIPTLTARENVEVPMRGIPRRSRRERATALLAQVGLAGRSGHLPAQLSGGERQRVAIARALANGPRLLLADEPTGNLDSASGAEVMAVFRQLNRQDGTTVMVVTHDLGIARATDRIIVLHDGRIVRDQVLDNPYLEDLRDFKASGLGQALLAGQVPVAIMPRELDPLVPALQRLLTRV